MTLSIYLIWCFAIRLDHLNQPSFVSIWNSILNTRFCILKHISSTLKTIATVFHTDNLLKATNLYKKIIFTKCKANNTTCIKETWFIKKSFRLKSKTISKPISAYNSKHSLKQAWFYELRPSSILNKRHLNKLKVLLPLHQFSIQTTNITLDTILNHHVGQYPNPFARLQFKIFGWSLFIGSKSMKNNWKYIGPRHALFHKLKRMAKENSKEWQHTNDLLIHNQASCFYGNN